MISLGVVIIGRDEAMGLRSLANILPSYPFDRIVYVDSNSSDESVAVARSARWLVVSLQPDGILSAPAGRAIGTLLCETDWIIYLDGDMQPNFGTLSHCIEYLRECSDASVAGITGDIIDVYNANSQRVRVQRSMHRGRAKWFGGAVILKRQLVLAAGNWNPNVYASEEIELYARLRKQGGSVVYFREPLVHHYTTYIPHREIILNFLYLRQRKNPRNGGLGLAIRSALKHGSFTSLISLNPEPFFVFVVTPLLLALGCFGSWAAAAIILLGLLLWIGQRRGLQYFPVCYLLMPQMLVGLVKYREGEVCYSTEGEKQAFV